ncbi:MAG: VIT domain-containing protein [Pseudomonadota bacterium]
MFVPVLALCAAVSAAPLDFLHDPVIYPDEVMDDDPVLGGEIRVTQADGLAALVLEHTSVVAEIHAGLARVTMTQWFHNPYEEPLEARYLFPLPSTAAVDRMDLTCGDRLIEGVIMERGEALAAYEQARDEGKKAALLEQERDNLFTQRIASLCPGEEVQITLQYVEQVAYEDGIYELTVPMAVGPRFSPPWVADRERISTPTTTEPVRAVDFTAYLDEGSPVGGIWSDSHDIDVVEEGAWGAEVTTAEEEVLPDRDFVLSWTLQGERPAIGVLAHRPSEDEPGYLAVTLEPPRLDEGFVARPRELLFVLDESGSMSGWPFETARALVLMALEEMGPDDTFNLVRFASSSSSLFARPQPATAETRAQARAWLAHFHGGGTNMDAGIVHSLDLPGDPEAMRLVLMLTDGYVGGEDTMFGLVRQHLGNARLFSLGVGSSVNRYLLEGLAEMGRGDVIYVYSNARLRAGVQEFYDRIAHPSLSDIRIDWGGIEVSEQYPVKIPDLWAGQPLRVVARYEPTEEGVDVDTVVTVRARYGREEVAWEVPLQVPAVEREHEALASLWARRKIRDLEWYPRGRSAAEVQEAVTEVALDHHLVSRYTSLVAIDDEPSACGPSGLSVSVPTLAPAGVSMVGGASLGGGGTAMGLGGLGTRGRGSGASGYGHGGGHFGARGVGSIGSVGGDAIILGSMDKTLIDAVVKRNLNALRYCYQRELQKDPALAGKVVVKFVVAADGSVASASIKSSTLGSAAVEQCLTARFLRMAFPAQRGGGVVIVSYPFLFSSGS